MIKIKRTCNLGNKWRKKVVDKTWNCKIIELKKICFTHFHVLPENFQFKQLPVLKLDKFPPDLWIRLI